MIARWFVGIMYLSGLILAYLWLMITFPGFINTDGTSESYHKWEQTTFFKVFSASITLWLALNVVSTIISIFAISKIYKTVKSVRITNNIVNFDYSSMILHTIVLIL